MGNFGNQVLGESGFAVAAKINLISLTDQDEMIFFTAEGVIGFVDLIDSDEVRASPNDAPAEKSKDSVKM